jgi:methionyl-tRNA formyltransferase
MKIVFMGTPDFAVPSLQGLVQSEHEVVAVVTAPDRPAGRGRRLRASPVKKVAQEMNLPLLQPDDLRDPEFLKQLKAVNADLFIVVAFRILPPEVFTIPPKGTVNLHASLLPKYRGAAPIHWAIIHGERETGVTTFFIEEKVDTGEIILQEKVAIGDEETAGELSERLADLGARVLLQTVRLIASGEVHRKKQKGAASKAPKITREMCRIDWSKTAVELHNFVRGLSPEPAAFCLFRGKEVKIYRTRPHDARTNFGPGTVVGVEEDQINVATGKGVISILELQLPGKRRMSAADFLRGNRLEVGDVFE